MEKHETNFLLLLATTVISIVGVSYLFSNKKNNEIQFLSNRNGFEKDSENLSLDIENIGQDFQTAKEKVFKNE
ncbi:hypothetical protein F7644_05945 [Tenacibaculum finnmarkense genomovar ulcerans]|uniref:hypothetical protein n=1 Tax=Tenacibaculum finnmarkense TaxID=2781243 RepID=UPI00187B3982|nr:hypothetical protein [Tenacibaculum finnmarkense]MBE7645530.1 hypothetical protein [Tenacibaculum finnmarkense genomovar ulcerans]